jgi:thymidylate synthase ThyX
MEFIEPDGFEEWNYAESIMFEDICERSEQAYAVMLNYKLKPQQARAVLSNALKTEIVVTADAAEWAHIRKLRTAKSSHPDMQRVMNMMPWESFL